MLRPHSIQTDKILIGWQEWCSLPKLHLPAIKAKIDTGAKTSALHAHEIKPFHRQGNLYVHFIIHPLQQNIQIERFCTAEVIDERMIMNSGGHKEKRYVIQTPITLGDLTWDIEITLTNRAPLSFRMLLGRRAIHQHALIDPGRILCQGKIPSRKIKEFYQQN
ncbi:MAG: ribosomal protein S6--L-glutamate ligase [Francisellaceae bacterium]|nr:ribosomal protein S6--L-glutamate ligase [Francisellaceae bacterium]